MTPGDANRSKLGYLPGLDGIRAVAVIIIIAFHTGITAIPGGYFSVDSFFTLSGFLITSLLIKEWAGSATVSLKRFWSRRARRLLPALFAMITVVGVIAVIWPNVLGSPDLLGDAISTLLYVANWHLIAEHSNYFYASGKVSPLLHTWTLAIEEQFYLVWPLVVLVVLKWWPERTGTLSRAGSGPVTASAVSAHELDSPRDPWTPEALRMAGDAAGTIEVPVYGQPGRTIRFPLPRPEDRANASEAPNHAPDDRRRRLVALLCVAGIGAVLSALLMASLAKTGADATRIYYGSDTRAQSLLVGAVLAVVFELWRPAELLRSTRSRTLMGLIGIAGVGGTLALWAFVPETSLLAFHGGFLLAALSTAAVIASVDAFPGGIISRFLSLQPLRSIGKISYGMYIWYWPTVLILSTPRVHLSGYPLLVLRLIVITFIASISSKYLELPIRRGSLPSWRAALAIPVGAGAALAAAALATSAVTAPVSASHIPPVTTQVTSPNGPPVKILLVGDSIAGTIGVGFDEVASSYGAEIINEGSPGCSLGMDGDFTFGYLNEQPGPPCKANDPSALLDHWQTWVDEYNPDVVMYIARGDLFNQQVGSTTEYVGEPAFDSYLTQRFEKAVDVLSSRGAHVVLATTPFYDSGDGANGQPFVEDQPQRADDDNSIIESVVASFDANAKKSTTYSASAPDVSVLDIGRLLSPNGTYTSTIEPKSDPTDQTTSAPIDVRCGDGVHISISGGEYIASKYLAQLVSMGKAHQQTGNATTSSTIAPPAAPVSPPSWWKELPCSQ